MKKIVEINGIKVEVDLREARVVDSFRVGNNVKVLTKSYDGSYVSAPGVIVGFDAFEKLPTIVVATLSVSYGECEIKFHYINAQTKDIELCLAQPGDLPFERERVLDLLDMEIVKKENELLAARGKKDLFERQFGKWFVTQTEGATV